MDTGVHPVLVRITIHFSSVSMEPFSVNLLLRAAFFLQWCVTTAFDPKAVFPGFCIPDGNDQDVCPVMCVSDKMCTYGTNGRCLKTLCGNCRCRYDEEELNGPIHCVSAARNTTACPRECFTNVQCKNKGTGKIGACVMGDCGNCYCDYTGSMSMVTTESHPSHSEFIPEKVKVSLGRKANTLPMYDPSLEMLQADCIPQLGYEVDPNCPNDCNFDSDCSTNGDSCQQASCGGCRCLPSVTEDLKDCTITSDECWSDCEHHSACGANGRCVPNPDQDCPGSCVCRDAPAAPAPETDGECWCDGDRTDDVDNYQDFLKDHLRLVPREENTQRKFDCVANVFHGEDCERLCCEHTECMWPQVCSQDDCDGCPCDYFDPLIYAREILGLVTSCGGRRSWPNPSGDGAYSNCDEGNGGMCVTDGDCRAGYVCLPDDTCGGCWCQGPNQ